MLDKKLMRERLELHPETVKQLPTLQKCIKERWEKLAKGVYSGTPQCQLCVEHPFHDCGDCVIKRATGEVQCKGTSFYKWRDTVPDNNKEYANDMLNELKDIEEVLIELKHKYGNLSS